MPHPWGRNAVIYDGAQTGTVAVTRTTTYADGRVETVPLAGTVGGVNGAVPDVWFDGDVPFGAKVDTVVYRVGSESLAVPPEDRAESIISDPTTGLSVNVIGTETGDVAWQSSTSVSWLNVTVGGAPLVAARPEQAAREELVLFTTTRRDREVLAQLCASRRPLLLRTPDSGVDDRYFILAGERVESRLFTQEAGDEWRRHSWECYTVPRPTSVRHAGETLGAIAATGATLADLAAQWSTLGAMAAAALTVEAEVGW